MTEYKWHKDKDAIKPLTQSDAYFELCACHEWGIIPSAFRKLPQVDQAEMMAFFIVKNEVEGYYNSESMKKMDKTKDNPGSGGRGKSMPTRTFNR